MRFESVSICSVTHVDAPIRVTSAALEDRLAPALTRLCIPRGLLEGLSGIVARRMWPEEFQPSDAAVLAAEQALAQAGVDRRRVGVLINCSVCRDYVEPSTAAIVHGKLGLGSDCLNFDVANACLGFMSAMDLVGNMIERGQIDYGLIVDGESSRYVIDRTVERLNGPSSEPAGTPGINDQPAFWANFATLTLGSGAAAMVLGRRDLAGPGRRFVGSVTLAASEHRNLCKGQTDHMLTDSTGLLASGLELAERTWAAAERELGWRHGALDEYVIHQVSKAHTDKLGARLALEPAKVLATYPEYGNVGPAGVPLALSKAAEMGRLRPGARVALMGIGSGLNCAMAEVIW